MGDGLATILDNFGPQIAYLWTAIVLVSYVLGLGLVGAALARYLNAGGTQQVRHSTTIWMLVAGTLMLNVPAMLNVISSSYLEQNSLQAISYGSYAAAGTKLTASFVNFFFTVAAILGLIAFIRGLWMLKNISEVQQTGEGGRAVLHILAGSAAINLPDVIKVLARTGGSDVLQFVEKFMN
jgi:hypothetical protein